MKFPDKYRGFWNGRNGADQFYQTLMWSCLVLAIINLFLRNWILNLLELLLLGYATFRLLSRNLYRRQKENQTYLNLLYGIKGNVRLCRNRFRDRKTHVYRKCPGCRKMLRLPKIRGNHTVCCPCCGNRFQTNV